MDYMEVLISVPHNVSLQELDLFTRQQLMSQILSSLFIILYRVLR